MLAINKNSKWLDNIGHICTVLEVPEDQEDLTKMMQYQYQVEYQRKNKNIPMYRFLEEMKPLQ